CRAGEPRPGAARAPAWWGAKTAAGVHRGAARWTGRGHAAGGPAVESATGNDQRPGRAWRGVSRLGRRIIAGSSALCRLPDLRYTRRPKEGENRAWMQTAGRA